MIYVLASHLFQRLWHALELLQMVFSLPHDSMAIRKVDLEVILEQICWVISVVEYCCQSKFLKIYFKKNSSLVSKLMTLAFPSAWTVCFDHNELAILHFQAITLFTVRQLLIMQKHV